MNLYGFVRNDGVNSMDYLGFIGTEVEISAELIGEGSNEFEVEWSQKTTTSGGACKKYGVTPFGGYGCIGGYEPLVESWRYHKESIAFTVSGKGEGSVFIDCDKKSVVKGQDAKISGLTTKVNDNTIGRFKFGSEEILSSASLAIGQEDWKDVNGEVSVSIPWSIWATASIKSTVGASTIDGDPIANLGFTNGNTKQVTIKKSGTLEHTCCKKKK
jgi:hypothetical protein